MGRKKCMWKNIKCKDLIGEDQRFLSAGVGDRTGHNWGYFVCECVSVWVCMCVCVSDTAWLHHTDATAQHCGVHESSISLLCRPVDLFLRPLLLIHFHFCPLLFPLPRPGDITLSNRGGCFSTLCYCGACGNFLWNVSYHKLSIVLSTA